MIYRKKLIEVALPLKKINEAAVTEKSISFGHPSTLHLWWARRPLAACRAVLFASLIDDPSEHLERFPTGQEQEQERDRLFRLIEEMVEWKNANKEETMARVRAEIQRATSGNPPAVLDPFAGGGSIPLEAQRLGLETYASDLNPVAVLINRALIEIPSRFVNHAPINPETKPFLLGNEWSGARGLAADIRYYGQWMRDEAEKRIGQLYPKVTLPRELGGGEANVIAWLWARTVTCPNPACGAQMPLASSFWLSKKKGKETWAEPVIDRTITPPVVRFVIKMGHNQPQASPKLGRGGQFRCLCCNGVAQEQYVKAEGMSKRLGAQLMAIVAESKGGRVYLAPTLEQEKVACTAEPEWIPEQEMPKNPRWFSPPIYGMATYGDIFTPRQLVALTTFSDLVQAARERIQTDASKAGLPTDDLAFRNGGQGAQAYAEAIATYLSMNISRLANRCASLCFWDTVGEKIQQVFGRQAIPMVWDFAESNPFSNSTGNFLGQLDYMLHVIEAMHCDTKGTAKQRDATTPNGLNNILISTDPPYYDNIGYADLSDFFYVWLRRSLSNIYPELFSTMLVPKTPELVAAPYRFGGSKSQAQTFFENGLEAAFRHMRAVHNPEYPMTVYYAFKQAETEGEATIVENEEVAKPANGNGKGKVSTASTGWETMLEGLIRSGFTITGTWPMRTELIGNLKKNVGALASSIVLVCRPRPVDAEAISQREFLRALRAELPRAMREIQHGNIAAVDFEQACIGPGMAIFSRYSRVEDAEGKAMRVRAALQFINRTKDEILAEQEGEYDAPSQWAVKWFEQYAMNAGPYGDAETLSKARNTSVASLEMSGLVDSRAGKVRLRTRAELPPVENLSGRTNLTTWEVTQRMIYELDPGNKAGQTEVGAAHILRQASEIGDLARDLAYRLYTICERNGWTQEAMSYNSLVASWSEITRLATREAVEVKQATIWQSQ